jgi:hypothetical protein
MAKSKKGRANVAAKNTTKFIIVPSAGEKTSSTWKLVVINYPTLNRYGFPGKYIFSGKKLIPKIYDHPDAFLNLDIEKDRLQEYFATVKHTISVGTVVYIATVGWKKDGSGEFFRAWCWETDAWITLEAARQAAEMRRKSVKIADDDAFLFKISIPLKTPHVYPNNSVKKFVDFFAPVVGNADSGELDFAASYQIAVQIWQKYRECHVGILSDHLGQVYGDGKTIFYKKNKNAPKCAWFSQTTGCAYLDNRSANEKNQPSWTLKK